MWGESEGGRNVREGKTGFCSRGGCSQFRGLVAATPTTQLQSKHTSGYVLEVPRFWYIGQMLFKQYFSNEERRLYELYGAQGSNVGQKEYKDLSYMKQQEIQPVPSSLWEAFECTLDSTISRGRRRCHDHSMCKV